MVWFQSRITSMRLHSLYRCVSPVAMSPRVSLRSPAKTIEFPISLALPDELDEVICVVSLAVVQVLSLFQVVVGVQMGGIGGWP